jgi:hypothetical protein
MKGGTMERVKDLQKKQATALDDLKKKHREQLEALRHETAIREKLAGMGIEPRMVSVGRDLYGRGIGLVFGDSFQGKGIGWEEVAHLADVLPTAKPLRWIEESCVSVKTAAFCEALPEEGKQRWTREQEIAPFWMEVDGGGSYGGSARIRWCFDLDEECFEVSCYLNDRQIHAAAHRKEYRGGFSYEQKRCIVPDYADRVNSLEDGEPLADVERHRMWSSSDHVGQHTLIWINLRIDRTAAVQDLAAAMLKNREQISS